MFLWRSCRESILTQECVDIFLTRCSSYSWSQVTIIRELLTHGQKRLKLARTNYDVTSCVEKTRHILIDRSCILPRGRPSRAVWGVSQLLIISRGNNNGDIGDKIWRQYAPVTIGGCDILWVDGFIWGIGTVSSTPALVPIQSSSLQANSAVTLRHAALCCRIMSSQPAANLTFPLK